MLVKLNTKTLLITSEVDKYFRVP